MGKRPDWSADALDLNVPDGVAPRPNRRYRWLVTAALLAVGGIVGAVLAANSVARNRVERSQQAFELSSAHIASDLQRALRRQGDLVVNASAYVLGNPTGSNAELAEWTNDAEVLARYPELGGLGEIVIVPAAELATFAERRKDDPLTEPTTEFVVVPPGVRDFYCLVAVAMVVNPAVATPAGLDFCADGTGDPLLAARDSGAGAYFPYEVGDRNWLVIQTPIYAGGVVPVTVDERRERFIGLVGVVTDPEVMLGRALLDHPGLAVSMTYDLNSSAAAFSSGTAPPGAHSTTVDFQNGWTVSTYGDVAAFGLFEGGALVALLAGVALSLLVAALVLVLGNGRVLAYRLVQRTGELRHQALHDALTGLPNRALIMDRIEQLLARNRRYATTPAALFIDLDDFKNVNDTLGHHAGDELLVAVAERLQSTLRDADTIGRMGGDEFVVLIDGASLDVAPELVAQRLLDVMRQPFELDASTTPLVISISIGIAMGDRATGGDLLRDADVALYEAKGAGKNRYERFDPTMQTEIVRRIELEFDLRVAVGAGRFALVYQPIYDLDNLAIVGVEALLRWDHPVLGPIEPDEFIPILEQNGQIDVVGRWVLQHACEQMAAWHSRGETLDLSVNVSGRQLDYDIIVDDIRDALASSGLEPTSLIIEVTETALMRDAVATVARLHAIKDLGVRIAVDDFGTGYSSLAYLQQFPVDYLKIDRRFTNAIGSSRDSKAFITTLVQLGRDLGLKTLAEGVETSDEMDYLRRERVDEAQGFLLSRPLDAESLAIKLLEAPLRASDLAGGYRPA